MPGKWHTKMENLFPEDMQEVKFYCSSKSFNTCRRADIYLSDTRTCEIQHSYISENEIINRFNDWNKFGKEIIWLIDGNFGIEIEQLSSRNYLIIFKELWKYKSFIKKALGCTDFKIRFDFHRTRGGLDVSPHIDSKGKIGSHLFYFMPDGWTDEMGGKTIFYRDRKVDKMNPEPEDFEDYTTTSVIGNRSCL